MFFLSGAAALIYEVVWVRSLSLIFGGSHLAVTTVLSVFMAGLALGSYAIGKYTGRIKKLLRFYGLLEIGIGLFAIVFAVLMKLYPSIYIFLSQGVDDSPFYLSFIRVTFSVIALIVPTTLMGGTLPVLSSLFSNNLPKRLGSHLSFLYGINTLGAVAGTAAAGFFLLRFYSVSTTLGIAVILNILIGLFCIALQEYAQALLVADREVLAQIPENEKKKSPESAKEKRVNLTSLRLILWGIGVSGFCALGYEVLWTRVLTIVVGASVYSFTTMLVAFLAGIALGSSAHGLFLKALPIRKDKPETFPLLSILVFGIVQVIIGISAILVTFYIRDLPAKSIYVQDYFLGRGYNLFGARQLTNFILAFSYMLIPAFFMGVAFPIAGKIHAGYKKIVGEAVGEVTAYNTVGAILGSALSGFALIYVFGIERSLQMLTVINIGFGLLVIISIMNIRLLKWGVSGIALAGILVLAVNPEAWRMWDRKYFAIYRSNQPEAFRTSEMIREAIENTEVLYYAEGLESTVSSITSKGAGEKSFLTNGRVEASSRLQDQQCQYVLGYLPMLLHKDPKKVLVVGLGSGMTLGATAVYPGVQKVTLVELEPKVVGVAKTFEDYNHHVLDNPRLKMVFNDGRNFLLTTREKFDVITADPIHPWFRGAGYLYTREYFKLAAEHLLPGGIICQWLPIYELTPKDIKTVARTFSENFKYTMLWLTHYDAEIVGSNSPLILDEAELERRIAQPAISGDLTRVLMGSGTDFLSYFVMGTRGMRAFSEGGIVNTDDNLYLEFSAPLSIATASVMEANVNAIIQHLESIVPYLVRPRGESVQKEQGEKWAVNREAARLTGRALAMFLGGRLKSPEFRKLMEETDVKYPLFAPGRFLKNEYRAAVYMEPKLLQKTSLMFLNEGGAEMRVEICAVTAPISRERVAVVIVDNERRIIFGQLIVEGSDKEKRIINFANDLIQNIQAAYHTELKIASGQKKAFPSAESTMPKIRNIIDAKCKEDIVSRGKHNYFKHS